MTTKRWQEHHAYWMLIVLVAAIYLLAGFAVQNTWFGFNQLRRLGLPLTLLCYAGIAALVWLAGGSRPGGGLRGQLVRGADRRGLFLRCVVYALVAILAVALFWSFRNNFINPDGRTFAEKFVRDVPVLGAHVTHDEMLELYIHSKFWWFASQHLGWSVIKSYQVLSSLAGGVAVFVLLWLCDWLVPANSIGLLLLTASCGFMQLFFGDPENYTFLSTLILIYLGAAYWYLRQEVSLLVPSVILAVAVVFHAIGGWLGPSLLYLYAVAWRRRQVRDIGAALLLSALVVVGTVVYLDVSGSLPLRAILHSHAMGDGRSILGMLAKPSLEYYGGIVNLLFLLFPFALIMVPLLAYKRIDTSPFGVFMMWAAGAMMAFMAVWEARLGALYDWNLFAPSVLVFALSCFYNLARIPDLKHKRTIEAALILVSALHSCAWIVSNHFFHP